MSKFVLYELEMLAGGKGFGFGIVVEFDAYKFSTKFSTYPSKFRRNQTTRSSALGFVFDMCLPLIDEFACRGGYGDWHVSVS